MKVLLVDDDDFLRDMYATKFSEAGHDVQVAKNGEAALEILSHESFDVMLTDMVMPGLTGIELLKKIQEEHESQVSVCIALSNQSEESDIAAAKEAGAKGYIIKAELVPSEVLARVEEIHKTTT